MYLVEKNRIKTKLKEYMNSINIIDAHEHLCPEKVHLNMNYNFSHLLRPYLQFDLCSAGMPKKWIWRDPQNASEIEQYWKDVASVWKFVKHGSYAKPVLMALKEFWGIEDINNSNYKEIGILLNETKKEGHYKQILLDKCKIEVVLNQCGVFSFEDSYLKGSIQTMDYVNSIAIRKYVDGSEKAVSLDEYVEYLKSEIKRAKEGYAILVKFSGTYFTKAPLKIKALEEFNIAKKSDNFLTLPWLEAYLCDEVLKYMAEMDLVAAIHTGVWDNITNKSPEYLFPVIERHPEVKFDIYHMGMPYVRECGFLGKNYHNAYLNLCWSHIVSPEMLINSVEEWLDYVPTNKIFGFGGDCTTNVELVWAHLEMAKDNLAEIFARRIIKEKIDVDSAKEIIKLWLYENPVKVYKLK